MTRIIYAHSWHNVLEHQLSYTLLCKTGPVPWTLIIYLPSGIYRTVKDIIHGMLKGLHNALGDIYLKSENTITSLGGNDCFYIHKKAQDFYELMLPQGWYVTLPKTLARTLGYLNHQKVNIRGDTGELIPFASGNVRVTLHFRRRASF